ncbi:Peptidase S15/CocE/NonD C-terminal [Penicillium malachiteum]|nr:Peptidase S15/CocE/NonD C-terminal [Penicillium malachiteum]
MMPEVTGHIVAHLNVSVTRDAGCPPPSEIDLFLTLRHISAAGKEVFYTGSSGEGVPVTRGWRRISMRATKPDHPRHRSWLPYRDYFATDVLPVVPGDIYTVDIEILPTNVVVEKGGRLILEVSSGDAEDSALLQHTHPPDRPASKL